METKMDIDEVILNIEAAEFLLRKLGINWKEAGAMKDSALRAAADLRNTLIALRMEHDQ